MQENGRTPSDGYNPIGICHRLFNFIMNSFLIRATKRVTLGTTTDPGPAREREDRSRALEQNPNEGNVIRPNGHDKGPARDDRSRALERDPNEGHVIRPDARDAGLARDDRSRALERDPNEGRVIRPDGHGPNPEILVEFRHKNGGSVMQRSKASDSDHVSVRENATKTRQRNRPRDQGDGNGSDRNVSKDKSDLIILDGENLPGRRHHLLSVASNINEKADAFIRSRKEAMEKI